MIHWKKYTFLSFRGWWNQNQYKLHFLLSFSNGKSSVCSPERLDLGSTWCQTSKTLNSLSKLNLVFVPVVQYLWCSLMWDFLDSDLPQCLVSSIYFSPNSYCIRFQQESHCRTVTFFVLWFLSVILCTTWISDLTEI